MATTTSETSKTISLKLLVDNNSNKVVFAEAEKEFVDFLFGLLQVPLGSIVRLLRNYGIAGSGCLSRVYESIQQLDPSYLQPNQSKDSLLCPNPAFPSNTDTPPLLQNFKPPNPEARSWYENTGYVRGVATYMVMDDLMVKPMSTISSITLLNTLNIKDVGSLREMEVDIDIKKGLELVTVSLYSTTVLTDVFLGPDVFLGHSAGTESGGPGLPPLFRPS